MEGSKVEGKTKNIFYKVLCSASLILRFLNICFHQISIDCLNVSQLTLFHKTPLEVYGREKNSRQKYFLIGTSSLYALSRNYFILEFIEDK